MTHAPLSLGEIFGTVDRRKALREAVFAVRGDPLTPKTKWDASSLQILQPALALRTWAGKRRDDGRIPIYNLFNHTPTPLTDGWSVRKSQAKDFRGLDLTYDSHNGTDFIVPPGTEVVAPAPGKVLRVSNEFHRGGLKIFVDHGDGIATSYGHLGRSLVREGDVVRRGGPIALSGYSGIDALLAFPFGCPHVHFNVWLDGEYVDPFSRGDAEVSMWRAHNDPGPSTRVAPEEDRFIPTEWSEKRIAHAVAACVDATLRAQLEAIAALDVRAMAVHMHRVYFPTRFSDLPPLYEVRHSRRPIFDLPFVDFAGIALDQGK